MKNNPTPCLCGAPDCLACFPSLGDTPKKKNYDWEPDPGDFTEKRPRKIKKKGQTK